MADQTYMAVHSDLCTPLNDKRDVLQLVELLIECGVDRITVQTAGNKTVTIEPAMHLPLNDFVKAINE